MPRLIVNADDLGLTSGVNRAILEAHARGIVTSATLMARGSAFHEAVETLLRSAAYRERRLSIGCHVVLVDGAPVSPHEGIRSLLEGSAFRRKISKFAWAAVRGRISADEVERESAAQIGKLQQAGIEVSHLDCHKHAHMFPVVLEGVLRAAKRMGVRAVRNPFEPAFARPAEIRGGLRSMETAWLHRIYARRFSASVRRHGLETTDGSIGVTATGSLDAQQFAAILRHLPEAGTYEFVCHPGYRDAQLDAAGTRLLQSRETELSVLCSPEALGLLGSSRVRLTNFWSLLPSLESNEPRTNSVP